MLVAVSDYTLREQSDGIATTVHQKKRGEVEFIREGSPRRWTNETSRSVQYLVVTFRSNGQSQWRPVSQPLQ